MATKTKTPTIRKRAADEKAHVSLLKSQLEVAKLNRQIKLQESWPENNVGWASIFTDIFERTRSTPEFYGFASLYDRRHGRNFPIWQTEQELSLMRMNSRLLVATNNYASGLQEGLTSYVIEEGFAYNAAAIDHKKPVEDVVDALQEFIEDFHDRNEWYGVQEPGIEQELFKRSNEDGEFFVCDFPDPSCPDRTLIRTAEPEQCGQPPGTDWREWSFGIHTPKNDAQHRLGYWITWEDTLAKGQFMSVGEVTHYRRNVRRSCKRGMPDFSFDTGDALRSGSRLREALGVGAAIQASIAGVREHDTATKEEVQSMQSALVEYLRTDPVSGNVESYERFKPGIIDCPSGLKWANPPNATNAAAHVQILQAVLRAAAVKWNAPEWLGSSDASNNNYASSLTAEHPFVKRVKREQPGYRESFLRLHWNAVKRYCEYHGGFPVPKRDESGRVYSVDLLDCDVLKKFVTIQVECPNPQSVNPLEQAQVLQIEKQNGVTSLRSWQHEIGRDPDTEDANNQEYEQEHGEQPGALPMPGQQPPGQPGQPGAGQPRLPSPKGGSPSANPFSESLLLETKDEGGHEHKGKGEGGGQFTAGNGGGADTTATTSEKTKRKPRDYGPMVGGNLDNTATRLQRDLAKHIKDFDAGNFESADAFHSHVQDVAQTAKDSFTENLVKASKAFRADLISHFGEEAMKTADWEEWKQSWRESKAEWSDAVDRLSAEASQHAETGRTSSDTKKAMAKHLYALAYRAKDIGDSFHELQTLYSDEVKKASEAMHKGAVKESKDESGHEHDTKERFGTGGSSSSDTAKPATEDPHAQWHSEADKLTGKPGVAGKILASAGQAGKFLKDKTKQLYMAMENRYGSKTAIAIFAAGHVVGLASPLVVLPGSTMIGMVPFAAMAEVYLQAKKGIQSLRGTGAVHEAEEAELSHAEIVSLAKKLVEQIKGEWEKLQNGQ